MEKRKVKKSEWLIIGAILAVALAAIGWMAWQGRNDEDLFAVVNIYGQDMAYINLDDPPKDYFTLADFDIPEAYQQIPVAFEVKNGAIRFVDVQCPDHICEAVGFIGRENYLPAVCMPNGVMLSVCTGKELREKLEK